MSSAGCAHSALACIAVQAALQAVGAKCLKHLVLTACTRVDDGWLQAQCDTRP